MTVELTQFLLARIAEDEVRANDWRLQDAAVMTVEHDDPIVFDSEPWLRVLAECEAKRQLVEKVAPLVEQISRYAVDGGSHYLPKSERWPHERMLKVLALPYADHPDYPDVRHP